MMGNDDNKKKKPQTADEIASIMAANMKANMENPDFLNEQELLKDEVRKDIIEKREERKKRQRKSK